MKFTEKVIKTVEETLAATKGIHAQIRELKAAYKAEKITGEDYRKQVAELNESLSQIHESSSRQLLAASAGYREAVAKATVIDGTMLHDDAKLLQLDMKMTAHQFEALAEKHKDNPLMVQLLQEYSNKHEGLYAGFLPTADGKIQAFEGFVGAAQNAIRTPDSLQSTFFQTGKYTPTFCTESE